MAADGSAEWPRRPWRAAPLLATRPTPGKGTCGEMSSAASAAMVSSSRTREGTDRAASQSKEGEYRGIANCSMT